MLINQLALLFLNMKNFAFRTRLSLSLKEKLLYFCYAVVNLLLPHTLQSAFARLSSSLPLRVVGSNGLFSIWCFTKCSFIHFRITLAGGGLKWTRTIDLTLIRRVL